MRKIIKLNEHDLKKMVTSVLNESLRYGLVIDSSEADEAYNFAMEALGKEELDDAIIRALPKDELSNILTYLFRMYELANDWYDYKNGE